MTLNGVAVFDPEDIAITEGGDLVLADVGDNSSVRKSIQLYRFPEPSPNSTTTDATRIDLRYPDGAHNAEAMLLTPDATSAVVFTKERNGVSAVFMAALNATTEQVMTRIGTITITGERHAQPNLVTAADLVGSVIVLRTYANGYTLSASAGKPLVVVLRATPKRFDLPPMVQGEALCASPDGHTLVTASESRGAKTFALAIGGFPL